MLCFGSRLMNRNCYCCMRDHIVFWRQCLFPTHNKEGRNCSEKLGVHITIFERFFKSECTIRSRCLMLCLLAISRQVFSGFFLPLSLSERQGRCDHNYGLSHLFGECQPAGKRAVTLSLAAYGRLSEQQGSRTASLHHQIGLLSCGNTVIFISAK